MTPPPKSTSFKCLHNAHATQASRVTVTLQFRMQCLLPTCIHQVQGSVLGTRHTSRNRTLEDPFLIGLEI